MPLFSAEELADAVHVVREVVPPTPAYAWPLLRRRTGVKTQNPAEQSRVRAQDRLRLVSMPAEKPAPAQAEAPSQEGNA